MTRFGSLILCATLGTGLLACGSDNTSPKDPLELVPLDNTVSGWTVDKAHSKDPTARAMSATTMVDAVGLIDGGADPFYAPPYTPKLFLWQNYLNSTLTAAPDGAQVSLYILEMPSADQASGLYTALLQYSDYRRKVGTADDWQTTSPPLGTSARIQDTGTQWWINFHQNVFYVEVMLDPSFGPAPDYTPGNTDLKQQSVRFAQAVAGGI
jgi:hypothetical protein